MSDEKLNERELITSFREQFSNTGKETLLGIGDDAAVVRPTKPSLVITTDAFTEWVHFRVDHIAPDQLGAKVFTATVSDCAAMGCAPKWVTVALATPDETPAHRIHQIYSGFRVAADRYQCDLVGGDTVRSMSDMTLSLTAIGEPFGERILTRSGVEEGDDLYVTGRLGGPAAALLLFEHAPDLTVQKRFHTSMFRFFEPEARVDIARILVTSLPVSALIDLSDGLSVDLHHLARESGVGFRVERELVPVLPSVNLVAAKMDVPPELIPLHGGEEFELLFTASPGREEQVIESITGKTGVEVTRIGIAVSADEGVLLVDGEGNEEPFREAGYEHF